MDEVWKVCESEYWSNISLKKKKIVRMDRSLVESIGNYFFTSEGTIGMNPFESMNDLENSMDRTNE